MSKLKSRRWNPKVCARCGKSYQPASGRQTLCDKCRFPPCRRCGEQIVIRGDKSDRGVYCSIACYNSVRVSPLETRPCTGCGAPITRKPFQFRRQPFCSNACKASCKWADPSFKSRVGQAIRDNEYHRSPAKKKQLDEARKRNRYSAAMRAKIRKARLRQHFPTKMTGIEKLFRDAFAELGLNPIMHKTMFGRFQPDFVFVAERVIVQADGDYWHSRPRGIIQDARFDKAAKKANWTVLRFKGSEINRDLEACVEKVVAMLKEKASVLL